MSFRTLSVGWSTSGCSPAKACKRATGFSYFDVLDMFETLENARDLLPWSIPITYPIRALYAWRSARQLRWLLDVSGVNATLTLWHAAEDAPYYSADDLLKLRKILRIGEAYYDLPADMRASFANRRSDYPPLPDEFDRHMLARHWRIVHGTDTASRQYLGSASVPLKRNWQLHATRAIEEPLKRLDLIVEFAPTDGAALSSRDRFLIAVRTCKDTDEFYRLDLSAKGALRVERGEFERDTSSASNDSVRWLSKGLVDESKLKKRMATVGALMRVGVELNEEDDMLTIHLEEVSTKQSIQLAIDTSQHMQGVAKPASKTELVIARLTRATPRPSATSVTPPTSTAVSASVILQLNSPDAAHLAVVHDMEARVRGQTSGGAASPSRRAGSFFLLLPFVILSLASR